MRYEARHQLHGESYQHIVEALGQEKADAEILRRLASFIGDQIAPQLRLEKQEIHLEYDPNDSDTWRRHPDDKIMEFRVAYLLIHPEQWRALVTAIKLVSVVLPQMSRWWLEELIRDIENK